MTKKKVLIITYYWPPSGGAGVQRWLKFIKYLPNYNWNPTVFTVRNGEYPVLDEALLKDVPEDINVIKGPIWEPYSFYKKITGRKKHDRINSSFLSQKRKKMVLFEKLSIWIRGNFFIPDARRFWIKPSIRILSKILEQNTFDAIISTGPPHSTHLIASTLAKRFSIPWLADFRDPWTNIDFYKDLMLSHWSDRKHRRLEKMVLSQADLVLTVGQTLAEELKELGSNNVHVVENGFDSKDLILQRPALDDKFTIAHIGSFTPSRNHKAFWIAISELIEEDNQFSKNFQLKLIGNIDFSVLESIKEFNLSSHLNHIPYLAHNLVVEQQMKSHLLLLLVNNTPNAKGIITGKIFEYMASSRPTLVIGPKDGDVSKIVKDCNAGEICDFSDVQHIKKYILDIFYKRVHYNPSVDAYSREKLTNKLSTLLHSIT